MRSSHNLAGRQRMLNSTIYFSRRYGFLLLVLYLISPLLLAGCARQTIPMTGISMPLPDVTRVSRLLPFTSETDLSSMRWSRAFEAFHARLALEYPFTDWKQIDWDSLYATYAPQIAEAEAAKDHEAYYTALRQYLYHIPDGQVQIGAMPEYRESAIGGSFGFSVMGIDDGRIIVHVLDEDGPAAHAGILWGSEVLEWNGMPVREALAQTDITWSTYPPATREGRSLMQQRLLTRAPVGEAATITFRNPEAEVPSTVSLYALADSYEMLDRTKLNRQYMSEFESPITTRTLPSGYGYIQVRFIAPTMTMPFPVRAFRSAVNGFVRDDAPGIIIDVRGNVGGTFAFVPSYAGHFYEGHRFYEDVAYYQADSGSFEVDPESRLRIEPRDPYYDGQVVVLINDATIGSGEGLPLALQGLPNARIMGFSGTHGSFGAGSRNINLPGDISVWYPLGRSLDEDGNIQVDANAAGQGGIQPDIRLPLNAGSLRMIYQEDIDFELQSAEYWLDNVPGATRDAETETGTDQETTASEEAVE